MAIIGKIRDKGWLVLVVVGVALAAFIMGDWSRITQGDEPKYGYGTIYGEKVDFTKFEEAVAIAEENAQRLATQQQQAPQPVDRDAVWRSFVEKQLLEREYEALGIEVSPAEFDAYLFGEDGFSVLPDLKNNFVDSTNTFNPKLLQARIEEMESSDDENVRKSWEDTKEYYTTRRKQEKYFDILGQGMYATKLEAKNEYQAQKEIKNISFVVKRYREIADDDINVTDDKLKAYYEEHKNDKKYETRIATREVRFFDIMINPSAEDSAEFNANMDEIKGGFASTADDSTYVLKNSELRFYTSGPYATALPKTHQNAKQHLNYPNYMDTVFENSNIGQIVGPYDQDGVQTIAKVIGFTSDTINARHILLQPEEGKEDQLEALADSIMGIINDDNFAELVEKYSKDTGSKEKEGDLGDFFFSTMVQPFAVFCADEPIGKIGKVRSQFGIHIVQVTGRRGKKYPRLAVIQKTLKPSTTTLDEKQDIAYNLLYDLGDKLQTKTDVDEKVALFDTIAQQNGFFPRPINIQDNGPTLYGFTSKYAEEKILELAFSEGANEGDLVGSPIKDKNKHVIAILSSIKGKGAPAFRDVKEAMRRDYVQDQKALRFISEMKGKSLSDIEGATIQKAEVTFANPQISGGGFEPDVVGAIFSAIKDGASTLPIKGKSGVYVVKIDKTVAAATAADYDQEVNTMNSALRGNLANEAKRALNKRAEVIDNRRLFQKQIRR